MTSSRKLKLARRCRKSDCPGPGPRASSSSLLRGPDFPLLTEGPSTTCLPSRSSSTRWLLVPGPSPWASSEALSAARSHALDSAMFRAQGGKSPGEEILALNDEDVASMTSS